MATAELTDKALSDALYRMMLIRRVEEEVIDLANSYDGLIRGHYHVVYRTGVVRRGRLLRVGAGRLCFHHSPQPRPRDGREVVSRAPCLPR